MDDVYLELTPPWPRSEALAIETDLTAEEKAVIKAGRKEREERPENFTPWVAVKTGENSRKG
ncbi:MAG: hypothetical protein FWG66_13125 [Spirochaetes bacterium]|nr:hypothetical protein [Spirochaetota bacterium]